MWERRKDQRYEIRKDVSAQVISEDHKENRSMVVTNISSSGARLSSREKLSRGTYLQMEINDCPSGLVADLGFWLKIQKEKVNLFARGKVSRTGPKQDELAVEFTKPPNVLNY